MEKSVTFRERFKAVDFQEVNRNFQKNFWLLVFVSTSFLFFSFLDIPFWFSVCFFIAFYWNWALASTEVRRKVHQKKYGLSFLRFILILNKVVENLLRINHPGRKKVTRTLSPLLFFLLIFLGTGQFFLTASLVGSISFEVMRRVNEQLL